MPRFAANLSMLYNEHAFIDRFAAAAADGFKGVEYLFPYAFDLAELLARLKANGLQQVLFNAPPGGTDAPGIDAAWAAGARGTASVPGREAEFRAGVELALRYADDALVLSRARVAAQGACAPTLTPALVQQVWNVQCQRLELGDEVPRLVA